MARKARIESSDSFYHVINRGNYRSFIFRAKVLNALRKSEVDTADAKRLDPWKLAIGSKMKRETSVSNKWLSERLHMGVARGVSSNCAIYRKQREAHCPHTKRLKDFTFAY